MRIEHCVVLTRDGFFFRSLSPSPPSQYPFPSVLVWVFTSSSALSTIPFVLPGFAFIHATPQCFRLRTSNRVMSASLCASRIRVQSFFIIVCSSNCECLCTLRPGLPTRALARVDLADFSRVGSTGVSAKPRAPWTCMGANTLGGASCVLP